jgi:hypothetical protein
MPDIRIIPCFFCGGDKGGYDGGNERWIECAACDGQGELEVEFEPVELDDLSRMVNPGSLS